MAKIGQNMASNMLKLGLEELRQANIPQQSVVAPQQPSFEQMLAQAAARGASRAQEREIER
jgi:hypothetical protein